MAAPEHDDAYYVSEGRSLIESLLGHTPKSWPADDVLAQTGRVCEGTLDEEEFGEALSGAVENGEPWAITLFRWVGVELGLEGKSGGETAPA